MPSRLALILVVVGSAAMGWPIAAMPHWPIHSEAQAQLPEIVPTPGMVITTTTRVKPGTYRLPGREGAAAITVRGANITVDMTGVVIEGGEPFADPDGYVGTGIEIDSGDHVTLKGATIRGYKTAILARKSPFLHLTGNDLSYNWKQRLWSGIEKESLVDWMSYHNNEKDEWLRFGAAIYLSECDDAEIDHNRAIRGQNGLMITRTARLRIWNNTFHFCRRSASACIARLTARSQQTRLRRARLQSRLLFPGPGLHRHPDVRTVEPQCVPSQLGHTRRRWPVPLGGAVDDGYGAGRRQ